ncbi:hypothetical protein [Tahibacter amnicola]|uniref:Cytochrome c domain-containing protein n=1 Tax=Tahibacter amnicola TaxID=2976241 RepID=A0ABY6BBH9_9GAMM|nr:hypothetical protein [Tahibacter amnicola]UXI67059.1 hypothetical protein N4264_20240 [Tahibacter amnicola]
MSKRALLPAVVSVLLVASAVAGGTDKSEKIAAPVAGDPVSEAQFAWGLFVDAMRPVNGSLNFETWTEQCQLNPQMAGCPTVVAGATKARFLHGSALRQSGGSDAKKTDTLQFGVECGAMATGKVGDYPVPANVKKGATFCEEVFVNASEKDFIVSNGLTTLNGQKTYGSTRSNAVTFPTSAVEIKADWVSPDSYSNPTFQCPDPTNSLYTETINGKCYALVGVHISSKVFPDWLWATFEPASNVTNPNRCDPALYDTCFDPWGTTSTTPYGKGKTVPQSPQLKALMASANLNKAFNNYYLTGVQTKFVDAAGKPIPLGNSFVEFNAQVPPGQASCITCHKYAYFDGEQQSPENNFGGPPAQPKGWPSIGYACNTGQTGNCTPVTPGSTSQDFSWMLGLMPVN